MTTFEIVRLALAGALFLFFIGWRMGLKETWKDRREKKRRQEAEEQESSRIRQARRRARQQKEAAARRTSQILKIGLQGLAQKSVTVAGHELWYLEGGVANRGATVLLLHGFASCKEDWKAFAGPLLEADLHVVAPDLPGFGQNEKVPNLSYEVTAQTKRIRALVQEIGLQTFHLVGSSLGGSIAAALTYGAPDQVASLTLIEPFGVRVPYESELDVALANGDHPLLVASPDDYDEALRFLFETPPEMPEVVARHRAEEAAAHQAFFREMWPQIRGGERAHLLDLLLPEIRRKTLVIQGARSKVTHPSTGQVIAAMVRGSLVVEIPECGHLPAVEKPAETARHFLRFLREEVPAVTSQSPSPS